MLTSDTCEFHANNPLYLISGTIIPRSRWELFPLYIPYAQTSSVHAQRLHSEAGRCGKWHVLHPPRNCKFTRYSYTQHTLRNCSTQCAFRIIKVWESSTHALFLYNCTPNTFRTRERSVGCIHFLFIHFLGNFVLLVKFENFLKLSKMSYLSHNFFYHAWITL